VAKKRTIGEFIFENKVVILFILLCIGGTVASGQTISYITGELMSRIARNSFLVLSLIIPVTAGMGLNFGIVIGAMATQIALFCTTHWGITGVTGLFATAALSVPLAVFFGFLVGELFNKMKGSEMIGGMVLGYFADGLYQLLFLFILGGVIPIDNPILMVPITGVGVTATIDLANTIKYSLDTIPLLSVLELAFYVTAAVTAILVMVKLVKKNTINWQKVLTPVAVLGVLFAVSFVPSIENLLQQDRVVMLTVFELGCVAVVLWYAVSFVLAKAGKTAFNRKKAIAHCGLAAVLYALSYIPAVYDALRMTKLPMTTYLLVFALCMFNNVLMSTRLGQNMRTVGQNRAVAHAAGINVDRTRVIAMILSTVLASWGQLIFLQNVGTFSTYGAHTQVGQFAIAALLVGGASVQKATNKQAILGVVLFHTMFIVAPLAGRNLFGNAIIGEYFRVFISYGVIALALAMHAWKKVIKPAVAANKKEEKTTSAPAA